MRRECVVISNEVVLRCSIRTAPRYGRTGAGIGDREEGRGQRLKEREGAAGERRARGSGVLGRRPSECTPDCCEGAPSCVTCTQTHKPAAMHSFPLWQAQACRLPGHSAQTARGGPTNSRTPPEPRARALSNGLAQRFVFHPCRTRSPLQTKHLCHAPDCTTQPQA